MLRKTIFSVLVIVAAGAVRPAFAADRPIPSTPVEVKTVPDVLTLWSLGHEPRADASHTYVVTHGLGGIQDRFFDLGKAILAADPQANVLVVDWSPGAVRTIGPFANPWAAAGQIDPTGDALGALLATLRMRHAFNPEAATFIGESFGNYVNNRAAEFLRQTGAGKVRRGLLLNPASENGGYRPPLVKLNYTHSVSFVSPSLFDTRQEMVLGRTPGPARRRGRRPCRGPWPARRDSRLGSWRTG
jgi:hypothetical protein